MTTKQDKQNCIEELEKLEEDLIKAIDLFYDRLNSNFEEMVPKSIADDPENEGSIVEL
jgi:hypothetical protein